MSTLGQKTGIGYYTSLEDKVRYGLRCCRKNNPLSCGNCPYVLLKNDDAEDISGCTSALAGDAEEYIDQLRGNKLYFMGDLPDETLKRLRISWK